MSAETIRDGLLQTGDGPGGLPVREKQGSLATYKKATAQAHPGEPIGDQMRPIADLTAYRNAKTITGDSADATVHARPSEMHPGEANGTVSPADIRKLRRIRDRAFFETDLARHPGEMHRNEYQARHAGRPDMGKPSVLSAHEAHAFRGDNRIYAQAASQPTVTEAGLPQRTPGAQRDQIPMSPFRAAPDRQVLQSGAIMEPATARPTFETRSSQTAEPQRSRWTPRGIYERARNRFTSRGNPNR